MFQLDEERKKVLEIRKSIACLETALDQMKEHADDLEEKLFEAWEIDKVGRS